MEYIPGAFAGEAGAEGLFWRLAGPMGGRPGLFLSDLAAAAEEGAATALAGTGVFFTAAAAFLGGLGVFLGAGAGLGAGVAA